MPRSSRIEGSATFTTVLSSMIMNRPNETAVRVHHLRFLCREHAGPHAAASSCRLDPRELGELVANPRDRGAVRLELRDRRAADLQQGPHVHEALQVQQEVVFPLPSPSGGALCHN